MDAGVLYAVRSHAEHVRNIFTGLSGCKLLFNFTLLRLNLSTVTEIPLLRLYDEKSPARRQNPQFKCNYLATWELNKNPVSCISVISLYSSLHLASLKRHGSRAIYVIDWKKKLQSSPQPAFALKHHTCGKRN